jgi:hypothetical protein
MAPSPKHTEPQARATRRSLASRVPAFLATIIAVTLIGIAIWGLWVSADIARVVAGAGASVAKHDLSASIFFLLWLVFFGPFLFFGVVILWSTFLPESRAWLAPLRMFSFLVGLRAAAEADGQRSPNKSREKALPASRPPQEVGLSPDSTHGPEDQ